MRLSIRPTSHLAAAGGGEGRDGSSLRFSSAWDAKIKIKKYKKKKILGRWESKAEISHIGLAELECDPWCSITYLRPFSGDGNGRRIRTGGSATKICIYVRKTTAGEHFPSLLLVCSTCFSLRSCFMQQAFPQQAAEPGLATGGAQASPSAL